MNFLIPISLGAIITALITPAVILFARRYGLMDDPHVRFHPAHTHTGIIPRAGGLALYMGFVVSLLIFFPLNKPLWGVVAGATLLTVIGLWDDKRDVNPYIRLATNAIATLLVVGAGIGIPYITNPLTGGVLHLDTWRIVFDFFGPHSILVWADLFAFIWIMWTINIIGWSAGVDGQMPGFVSISALVIGLLAYKFSLKDPSQELVAIMAFIVSGVYLGFLPWNFYPQKIMPGYGGKTLAGFLLAILGILSYGKVGTAILVLGIPTIDACYTLLRRLVTGKSPVWADRGHLHHLLLDIGWGKRRIALFYWLVSAILGALALTVSSQQKIFTFILLTVGVGGFIVWLHFFTQFSKPSDPDNG